MISRTFLRIACLVLGLAVSHAAQAQGQGASVKPTTTELLASEGISFSIPKRWDTADDSPKRRFILMAPEPEDDPPTIMLDLKSDRRELSSSDTAHDFLAQVLNDPGTTKAELFTVERSAGRTFYVVRREWLAAGVSRTQWSTVLRLKGNGRLFINAVCLTSAKETQRAVFLKFLASIKGDQP